MIYIVSGYMRSGTSMMMRALEAGGLEAVYSKKRDENMNRRWGEPDFIPNDSYYELEWADYMAPDFPRAYEGKLIKVMRGHLIKIPPGEYRVVVMRRPAREIALSYMAAFGDVPTEVERGFDAAMDTYVSILRDRRSFLSVDEVWFRDAVERPHEVLSRLGWPIDVEKAASVPARDRVRFAA